MPDEKRAVSSHMWSGQMAALDFQCGCWSRLIERIPRTESVVGSTFSHGRLQTSFETNLRCSMAGPIAVAQQFALTAPPTPAAAALELLTPAAKTAPPGDDHILGRLLAKAPPPPGVEKPPRDDQILGRLLAKAPPPPNPEKDAQLLGGLIAKARRRVAWNRSFSAQEARDASVLDGFLRKAG